jgi:putative effector of murein hydrolase
MMLRELFSSMGFTLSVFAAVAVVFFYAVFFDAPGDLVASMLGLGVTTAIAEYVMRSQAREP